MWRLTAALVLGISSAHVGNLVAQEREGQVLLPGQLQLTVGGHSVRADSRFGVGSEGLAAGLNGSLTPQSFSGLSQMSGVVASFVAATSSTPGAGPIDPASGVAGDLSTELSSNYRYLPIRLGIGVLPRLELAVQLPVFRTENLFTRFDLTPGNVGVNAAPAEVATILTRIGPEGAALAASPLLPLSDSPLGIELRKRVLALTGEELPLPTAAVTYAELLSRYPTLLPALRTMSAWQIGDLEIEARAELLRNFAGEFFPENRSGGVAYRVTGIAAGRIPTGTRDEEATGFGIQPGVGHAGARFGAVADLFFGSHYWLTTGGTLEMLGDAEIATFATEGPLSDFGRTTITRTPGAFIDLWAEPRRRLTDELAIGLLARSEIWGDGEDDIAGVVVPIAGGARHSIGGSLSYSTLTASEATRGLPLEASLGFTTAVVGTDGVPRTTVAYFQLSLLQRLWGGRGRVE